MVTKTEVVDTCRESVNHYLQKIYKKYEQFLGKRVKGL